LTRAEAFDLVRRAVDDLAPGDESVRASDVRSRARQLLGRDSESLSDRMFVRILKDAHDEGIIDLRRRGNDFEVARAAEAPTVSEQLERSERAAVAATPSAPSAPTPRIGMGPRGAGLRGRLAPPPPELLSIGVVEDIPSQRAPDASAAPSNGAQREAKAKRGRGGRGAKRAAPSGTAAPSAEAASNGAAPRAKRGAKKGGRPRKKAAANSEE
jgi:hypothetical protein